MGDIKDSVSEKGSVFTLSLQGDEVPEMFNLAATAAAERAHDPESRKEMPWREWFTLDEDAMRQLCLAQEVKIERFEMQTALDDGGLPTDSSMKTLFSGKDAEGKAHACGNRCPSG